jgi:hypothetical protein
LPVALGDSSRRLAVYLGQQFVRIAFERRVLDDFLSLGRRGFLALLLAAPASPAPLRNVRRSVRFDQTVPCEGWSIPGKGFMPPPGYGVHRRW